MNPQQKQIELIQAKFAHRLLNPVYFINKILGLPLHESQLTWVKNANRKICILRPGNRWGKSFIEACLHIWHGMTKPLINENIETTKDFFETRYETLNFGPEYEQAREVLRLAVDIVQGKILLPPRYREKWGKTNDSQLKDWAILTDRSNSYNLPYVEWVTKARLLGRSYSDMGAAFKAKAIAFITGDECADINELWTFTNITLLPRLVSFGGVIHFVGTVQSEGHDYMKMIDMAEEDMLRPDWKENGNYYVQKGSMYENEFLDKKEIQKTEDIADEMLRKQIIYGEYVETGDKYFGYERVANCIDNTITLLEKGIDGRMYIVTVDFAGGDRAWSDYTVIKVIDYTEEPYRVVYFFRIKGGDMPIPMQYKKVEEVVENFLKSRLIIDATALGGLNALQFLRHLNPIPLKITAAVKSAMVSTLKVALDGGQSKDRRRTLEVQADKTVMDMVQPWGLIRFPDIPPLVSEMNNYKLDDKKIRTDCVMTLAQAIYWIELRRPKLRRKRAVDFDIIAAV